MKRSSDTTLLRVRFLEDDQNTREEEKKLRRREEERVMRSAWFFQGHTEGG
jgi:hypothetical protein